MPPFGWIFDVFPSSTKTANQTLTSQKRIFKSQSVFCTAAISGTSVLLWAIFHAVSTAFGEDIGHNAIMSKDL